MVSHNNGISWKKEIAVVAVKYTKLNFNSVKAPYQEQNKSMCCQSVFFSQCYIVNIRVSQIYKTN